MKTKGRVHEATGMVEFIEVHIGNVFVVLCRYVFKNGFVRSFASFTNRCEFAL